MQHSVTSLDGMSNTPDRIEEAVRRTAEHLYSLSDDCPPALAQRIATLRQLVNETNTTLGSQQIWDILKPGYHQDLEARERAARIEEVKRAMREIQTIIDPPFHVLRSRMPRGTYKDRGLSVLQSYKNHLDGLTKGQPE